MYLIGVSLSTRDINFNLSPLISTYFEFPGDVSIHSFSNLSNFTGVFIVGCEFKRRTLLLLAPGVAKVILLSDSEICEVDVEIRLAAIITFCGVITEKLLICSHNVFCTVNGWVIWVNFAFSIGVDMFWGDGVNAFLVVFSRKCLEVITGESPVKSMTDLLFPLASSILSVLLYECSSITDTPALHKSNAAFIDSLIFCSLSTSCLKYTSRFFRFSSSISRAYFSGYLRRCINPFNSSSPCFENSPRVGSIFW